MFFPYSLNLRLYRTPYISVLVGSLCFLFFVIQTLSEKQYIRDAKTYCKNDLTEEIRLIFDKAGGNSINGCAAFFIKLDHSNDLFTDIDYFSYKAQLTKNEESIVIKEFQRFDNIVQNNFTSDLWHNPQNPQILSYFTSSILHSNIEHIVFNLIFFFAFAIALEQTIGSLLFSLFLSACCITTGIAYEHGLFGASKGVLPTIGLSGIVSGVMGFCLAVYPLKRVKIFYWFIVFFGSLKLPLIIVVGFYTLSDLYGLKYLTNEHNVNYVSHISGTATGIACGAIYLIYKFVSHQKTNTDH